MYIERCNTVTEDRWCLGSAGWWPMVLLSGFGVWVLAGVTKRRGQTQNSIFDRSWTIPLEGYAFWTHQWGSYFYQIDESSTRWTDLDTLSCAFGWYYLGPFLRGTSASPTVIISQDTNCCSYTEPNLVSVSKERSFVPRACCLFRWHQNWPWQGRDCQNVATPSRHQRAPKLHWPRKLL